VSRSSQRVRPQSAGYLELKRFLDERMAMSHVYQPLMIRTILAGGGAATRRQIASAFLAADLSQLEYYEQITQGYPTQTLKRHGLISHSRGVYRLADDLVDLNEWERAALIALCDHKLPDYVARRQDAIWRHRAQNFDPIPGTLRYQVIVRARGRCEACGVSNQERALQVDHITPRAQGGTNDPHNLQALCSTCNAQKLDRDRTDFHAAHHDYDLRREGCSACEPSEATILAKNSLALALQRENGIHISPLRHTSSYAALTQAEVNAIRSLELAVLEQLPRRDGVVHRMTAEWLSETGSDHFCIRLETHPTEQWA
jgi:ATP adenylyltransferase